MFLVRGKYDTYNDEMSYDQYYNIAPGSITTIVPAKLQIKSRLKGKEDENEELRLVNTKMLAECNEEMLMMQLAELQTINPESIINLAMSMDNENICRKVNHHLDAIKAYLQACHEPKKDLYTQLIKGLFKFNEKLCIDNPFRTKFLKHEACLSKLKGDYLECIGPPDWIEDVDSKFVCSVFKDILSCYYMKSAKLCGTNAATEMQDLAEAIIVVVVEAKCHGIKNKTKIKEQLKEKVTKPKMLKSITNPIQVTVPVYKLVKKKD